MRLGRFGLSSDLSAALRDQWLELQDLEPEARHEALMALSPETLAALAALQYEWGLFGRPEQLPPEGDWRWWVMAGGRGGGKTRAAAEVVNEWAFENPGTRIAFVGKDAGGVRRVMVGGESGILQRSPPWFRPRWFKGEKLLRWPNGTLAELHSSEEPETLRGPQYHFAWVTELFHWQIPRGEREPTAWREGIKLTLRLGEKPKGIIDSSPRQTEFCADLLLGRKRRDGSRAISQAQIESGEWTISHELEDHRGRKHVYRVVIRRWESERNADNLSPGVVAEWRHDLRGTRLEGQELEGRILTKVEGALWTMEMLDDNRVTSLPQLRRVLVALDPTRSDAPRDEAGIVVGGLGEDGHVYVWDDCTVGGTPLKWAKAAVQARNRHQAEAIVREKNRLDAALRATVDQVAPGVKWIDVQASEGKKTRAEPVSAAYEQGKVHHYRDPRDPDRLALLEDELISWDPRVPGASPNRMDALVWLVTELLGLHAEVRQEIRLL